MQSETGPADYTMRIEASAIEIAPKRIVSAIIYNGQFPGPLLRFKEGQAVTVDPRARAKIVRAFERHALTEANAVPFLWWNRIVVTSQSVKGWHLTPSHYLEQDLTDAWLDK